MCKACGSQAWLYSQLQVTMSASRQSLSDSGLALQDAGNTSSVTSFLDSLKIDVL